MKYEIAKTILSELNAEEAMQDLIELDLKKCESHVENNFFITEKLSIEYIGKTIKKGNKENWIYFKNNKCIRKL